MIITGISSGLRRYLSNTAWMVGEKIIRILLNLFIAVYVARYLGPEEFGILNYAISFVVLFSSFAILGLDGVVVRNLVDSPSDRDFILGSAFALKLCGSIVLIGLVYYSLMFTSADSLTIRMICVISAGMIFRSLGVIDFFFQSTVQAQLNTFSQFCAAVISSFYQIGLIFYNAPLICFAWAVVLENFALSIAQIFTYIYKNYSVFRWRFTLNCAAELLRDSWPLFLSGVMVMIYMRIDQVMIKEMLSNEMVGNYAAAVRISEAWYFIPMAITASVFPAVMNARKMNKIAYFARLQLLFDVMCWIAILIAIPVTFLSDSGIRILYGEKYLYAGDVLKIHIWSGIFVFWGVTSSKYLLAENLVMISFLQTAMGCIANIILNVMLIPKFGIIGAAWATFFSYGIAVLSLFWNAKSKIVLTMVMRSVFPFGRAVKFVKDKKVT